MTYPPEFAAWSPEPQVPNGEAKQVSLKVSNGRELAKKTPPEREWEIQDMIPAARVTGISGDGAAGKSLLAQQLCISVASGTDIVGKLPRKGKALFLTCEDDIAEMHRRLWDIIKDRGYINRDDLVNFEIIDMVGEDALLASLDGRSGRLIPTAFHAAIVTHIEKFFGPYKDSEQGRILILDTLAKVYGGDENVRTQVTQFIGFLDRIAIKYHVAIILLLHPSLAGMASGTGLSGSTGWHGSMRARLYLTSVSNGDGEPDPCLRQLTVKKNNYGPQGETIPLRWEKGRYELVAGAGTIERAAEQAKADDAFLRRLGEFTAQGRIVSDRRGTNYAPTRFSDIENGGCDMRQYQSAMERLFKAEKIMVETEGSKHHRVNRIVKT